jgi:molybdate transport repressor ModE-like protein
MKIKHKVWIEKDDEIIMGMGREALLRAIKETGSITKAAEKVGLNYTKAMSYIKAMEERSGQKIIITFKGGTEKGGAKLTEFGEGLLKDFERIVKEYEKLRERLQKGLKRRKYLSMIAYPKKEENKDVEQ